MHYVMLKFKLKLQLENITIYFPKNNFFFFLFSLRPVHVTSFLALKHTRKVTFRNLLPNYALETYVFTLAKKKKKIS